MVTDLLAVNHKGCGGSICDPAVNPSDPQLSKVAEQLFSHMMNYCITGSNWPADPSKQTDILPGLGLVRSELDTPKPQFKKKKKS